MSIKNKYKVISIKASDTYDWLINKHYAHRIPSISYAFGLFDKNGTLQGVCTFGKPPSPPLCIGICGAKMSKYVYELNRLVINSGLDKNVLSFFVSRCLKTINGKKIIVSYADSSQNHFGYIYQATNWIYTGLSAKRTERYDPQNPNKHSKTVVETMDYDSLGIRDRPQKHRYVYFIGSKADKKKFLNNLKYNILPYPKGDNKRYDASYKPYVQGVLSFD